MNAKSSIYILSDIYKKISNEAFSAENIIPREYVGL